MIHCKKHTIAAFLFGLMLPLTLWSQAPVVDDSDNFAMTEEQQEWGSPVVASGYDDSRFDKTQDDRSQKYSSAAEDESPLVKEEPRNPRSQFNDNANLIDKIQSLRQEIQELRGQLEVQAHDLKLLQQQQIAFYKDLDSRVSPGSTKPSQSNPVVDPTAALGKTPVSPVLESKPQPQVMKPSYPTTTIKPVVSVSRVNLADEQISYLAAYELIKNKRFDEALQSMQTFAQKYPQGGYTANAHYWLGELYLVKKDYAKSIEHFEIVLEHFPSSSKAAASMLKDGYAYAASGDVISAKKRLQQVIRRYPNTTSAQLATTKLISFDA